MSLHTYLPRVETFLDGLTLLMDDRGTGRPVLLLHGGGGPASVARVAEALSATARVVTPTHPGFSGTTRPGSFTKVRDIALAYAALVRRLELSEVLVIGFSMGGWIASELALCAAGLLRGIVLVNAVGAAVDGEAVANVFALAPQQLSALSLHNPSKFAVDPAALTAQQKAMLAANFQAMAVYGRELEMQDPTLRPRLEKVATPVLVAWGESDRIVSQAYGRAYASAFGNARFELLTECGHMPQVEQFDKLIQAISRFDETLGRKRMQDGPSMA